MDLSSGKLVIAVENPASQDALALIAKLTGELSRKYDDDGGALSFDPASAAAQGTLFLVARFEGEPVGCGAIRPLEPGVAEIKRMFVLPEVRGHGLGRRILLELELIAHRMGYLRLRLGTGLSQPEAIKLYQSAGYQRVTCYGTYTDSSINICFEKHL